MSPELLFWSALALKMAMTATIVVVISVVVERSGPFVGALIAALPTAAGAAYIILAIEHPPVFSRDPDFAVQLIEWAVFRVLLEHFPCPIVMVIKKSRIERSS